MRRLISFVLVTLVYGMAVPVLAQSAAGGSADPPSEQPTTARPAPQTPGVRPGGYNLGDVVRVGGYGSMRFETNNLESPKPAGFDFRRFVLTTDATPHERVQAYVEIEFERLAEIEIERSVERSTGGAKFKEELEGGTAVRSPLSRCGDSSSLAIRCRCASARFSRPSAAST